MDMIVRKWLYTSGKQAIHASWAVLRGTRASDFHGAAEKVISLE